MGNKGWIHGKLAGLSHGLGCHIWGSALGLGRRVGTGIKERVRVLFSWLLICWCGFGAFIWVLYIVKMKKKMNFLFFSIFREKEIFLGFVVRKGYGSLHLVVLRLWGWQVELFRSKWEVTVCTPFASVAYSAISSVTISIWKLHLPLYTPNFSTKQTFLTTHL